MPWLLVCSKHGLQSFNPTLIQRTRKSRKQIPNRTGQCPIPLHGSLSTEPCFNCTNPFLFCASRLVLLHCSLFLPFPERKSWGYILSHCAGASVLKPLIEHTVWPVTRTSNTDGGAAGNRKLIATSVLSYAAFSAEQSTSHFHRTLNRRLRCLVLTKSALRFCKYLCGWRPWGSALFPGDVYNQFEALEKSLPDANKASIVSQTDVVMYRQEPLDMYVSRIGQIQSNETDLSRTAKKIVEALFKEGVGGSYMKVADLTMEQQDVVAGVIAMSRRKDKEDIVDDDDDDDDDGDGPDASTRRRRREALPMNEEVFVASPAVGSAYNSILKVRYLSSNATSTH